MNYLSGKFIVLSEESTLDADCLSNAQSTLQVERSACTFSVNSFLELLFKELKALCFHYSAC